MNAPQPVDIQSLLKRALTQPALGEQEAYDAFSMVMSGAADSAQIASLLTILAQRGPTVEELVGAARVMREHVTAVPVAADLRDHVIDTCGTGGAPKTFNVSTAAALVAAGAGAVVAKHGNRSRTGRGSAEVLQSLGVNVDASPEVQARCLEQAGLCFSFAIHHHPAIKHAMPARRALGFPTMFNLLGPLTNPAGARRQLIGVYAAPLASLLARTLSRLGSVRAMVVHGDGGLDELSITGPSQICDCQGDAVQTGSCDPRSLGLRPAEFSDLAATDLADSVRIVERVLDGDPGPALDIVVLNAAAALVVAGAAADLEQGVAAARESIASGKARAALDALVRVSNQG